MANIRDMWPVSETLLKGKISMAKGCNKRAGSASAQRHQILVGLLAKGKPVTGQQYVDACLATNGKVGTASQIRGDLVWGTDRDFFRVAGYTPTGASLGKRAAAKSAPSAPALPKVAKPKAAKPAIKSGKAA